VDYVSVFFIGVFVIVEANVLADHLIDLRGHLLLHLLTNYSAVDDQQDKESYHHQHNDKDNCRSE
jgi:hypothetical protein